MKHAVLILIACVISFQLEPGIDATIARCQANCAAPDRRVGPRKPHTRPHPWAIAPFPTAFMGFCNLGCQLFFAEKPTNTSCKTACDFLYRYRVTVGYSDLIEIAINECFDGCDIALLTCQSGYYCTAGAMLPCTPGYYRENQTDDSVKSCIGCPLGRYRPNDKGTSANTCSKCPIGKYANQYGGTSVESCIRCPAGTIAEEEGMGACKNITIDSDNYVYQLVDTSSTFYSNGVDFDRETVPYTGRS